MTVNTTNITSGPFVGNDIADEFSYAFRVEDKTQLKVIETDLLGVQTVLTVDTDYTVAGIGVDAGGLVTRVAGPLPTDFTWFIRSDYKQTQLTAFSSQGAFFPDLHEAAIDQLTFLIQQLQDGEDRTFKLSDTIDIDGVFTIVQDAAARAGLFLGFDTNGDLAASLGGFLSQPEQDIRFGLKTATVASLKLLSLPSGATVSTGGYYDGWAAFLEPQGAGEYNTATLAEVRTAKSDGAWVPDEWVNHTLANGTIAMLNLDGPLNAMKAGVVADNVTDDLAAFKAALAESDVLDCTGLTIRLEVVDVTVFTVSGKEIIGGAIDVIVPDTSFRLIFSADNFTLNGCTFTHSIPVGGQVAFVRPTGDNVFITGNCNIDGGVFDNTGAESHSFFLIQAEGTGTQRRCIAEDSIISNVSFCHLKTNTTTSTQLGWKFNRNTVSGVFVEGAGLNSPVGVVEDFEIVGNTFLTHFGTLTGAFGLYIACATGRDIKITGNSFYGVVDQCIHLEEGIKDFVISGNTGNVDAKAGAIALLENNVAGPTVFPSEGIISKNTIRKAGTLRESGSIGISLIANGSADSPASDISITDNIMTGFERDYYLDADVDDTSLVTGNVANDATDGFFITRSFGDTKGNKSVDCVNGLSSPSALAVMVSDHTFSRCTNLYSGRFILDDLQINLAEYAIGAAATVNTNLFPTTANMRINLTGVTRSVRDSAASNTSIKHFGFTFDGTTAVTTALNTIEPGVVQSFFEESGGNVRLRVFNGGSAGDMDSKIILNGFISDMT